MKFRKVDYAMLVRQKIALVQAGVKVGTNDLEAHYLARGNVPKVATAVIAAHKAGIELPWRIAAAIDLAGRDILDAVKTSVNPKVIDCPDPSKGRPTLDGVCKNGIQLKTRARVTVRTKLDRLVGGATEETIIARVGEGIVKAIGSAEHHTDVLANPNLISQAVLKNSLDSQTAFEIVSIDVAEIDVGANIGANLQADQASADLRVAQAHAERARAEAVAQEQVMHARVEENHAKVVLAEAEIPLAMAQAFREGNLGVKDYSSIANPIRKCVTLSPPSAVARIGRCRQNLGCVIALHHQGAHAPARRGAAKLKVGHAIPARARSTVHAWPRPPKVYPGIP